VDGWMDELLLLFLLFCVLARDAIDHCCIHVCLGKSQLSSEVVSDIPELRGVGCPNTSTVM
jgi:hypothetical protein